MKLKIIDVLCRRTTRKRIIKTLLLLIHTHPNKEVQLATSRNLGQHPPFVFRCFCAHFLQPADRFHLVQITLANTGGAAAGRPVSEPQYAQNVNIQLLGVDTVTTVTAAAVAAVTAETSAEHIPWWATLPTMGLHIGGAGGAWATSRRAAAKIWHHHCLDGCCRLPLPFVPLPLPFVPLPLPFVPLP